MKRHLFSNTQCPSVNMDALHAIIKNFRTAFPDNFKKCGLQICSKCEGSGASVKENQKGVTFWNDGDYCSLCNGFGVLGITKIYDEYLCKKCGGKGCSYCNDKGSVDWITNVVKR